MTEWDDQIVILRLGLFHEADLWLRAISRKQGLVTVFAFGGARSKHRFCGCLDKFNTLQCRIKGNRNGYLNLLEASLLEAPRVLRHDWRKMGVAANCMRFMEAMRIDSDSAQGSFLLVEDLRRSLENAQGSQNLTTFFFRLNLASLIGFEPDLDKCGLCGREERGEYTFIPEEGQIFCPSCVQRLEEGQRRHGLSVSPAALTRLAQVRRSLPTSWREDDLSEAEKKSCARLVDCFVRYHLGIAWENGAFRTV